MISVAAHPEYPQFDAEVRRPGLEFLEKNPHPSAREFRKHGYWSKAREKLHTAYSGFCAYTSMRLADTGSVDHFRPKVKYPHLAYEWDNYRLTRPKINTRKGDTENVIDPFEVKLGWFILDLPSCLIRPGTQINEESAKAVDATIQILKLNTDDNLVQERCNFLVQLAEGNITLSFLDWYYPFLSVEVRRQGIEHDLNLIFKRMNHNF